MSERKVRIQVGEFDLHHLQLENWDGRSIDVFYVGWPIMVEIANGESNEVEDKKEMYLGFRLTRNLADMVVNGREVEALEELYKNIGLIYLHELKEQYCEDNERWYRCGEMLKPVNTIADKELLEKFREELRRLIDKKKTEIENIVRNIVECVLSGKEECEY